jgi:hypothetical protein
MTGDFEATAMRLLDRRAQLVARDIRVRLERRRTVVCPERDGLSRILGARLGSRP